MSLRPGSEAGIWANTCMTATMSSGPAFWLTEQSGERRTGTVLLDDLEQLHHRWVHTPEDIHALCRHQRGVDLLERQGQEGVDVFRDRHDDGAVGGKAGGGKRRQGIAAGGLGIDIDHRDRGRHVLEAFKRVVCARHERLSVENVPLGRWNEKGRQVERFAPRRAQRRRRNNGEGRPLLGEKRLERNAALYGLKLEVLSEAGHILVKSGRDLRERLVVRVGIVQDDHLLRVGARRSFRRPHGRQPQLDSQESAQPNPAKTAATRRRGPRAPAACFERSKTEDQTRGLGRIAERPHATSAA